MQVQEAPPRLPAAELPHVAPPPSPDGRGARAGLAAGCALLWAAGLVLAAFARDRWGLGGEGVVVLGALAATAAVVGSVLAAVAWTRARSFFAAFVDPWLSPPGWAVFAVGVAVGLPFTAT